MLESLNQQVEKFQNKLCLYGAMTQPEMISYIRAQCIASEADKLEEITKNWRNATSHFQEVIRSEAGLCDTVEIRDIELGDIEPSLSRRLDEVSNDELFRYTFSYLPFEFKMVEVDKMIACQRSIDLDYVETLKKEFPSDPSKSDLVEICLAPKKRIDQLYPLQVGQNAFVFSAASSDFRFLGGYPKPLTDDDRKACLGGGSPVAALVLLVGYGAAQVNVYSVGKRIILNNGFHRVYALRDIGMRYVPAVVQNITNPELEFPPAILGLPKEYLLNSSRPALVKDFFDEKLVRKLKIKARMRTVKIAWGAEQTDAPLT